MAKITTQPPKVRRWAYTFTALLTAHPQSRQPCSDDHGRAALALHTHHLHLILRKKLKEKKKSRGKNSTPNPPPCSHRLGTFQSFRLGHGHYWERTFHPWNENRREPGMLQCRGRDRILPLTSISLTRGHANPGTHVKTFPMALVPRPRPWSAARHKALNRGNRKQGLNCKICSSSPGKLTQIRRLFTSLSKPLK